MIIRNKSLNVLKIFNVIIFIIAFRNDFGNLNFYDLYVHTFAESKKTLGQFC